MATSLVGIITLISFVFICLFRINSCTSVVRTTLWALHAARVSVGLSVVSSKLASLFTIWSFIFCMRQVNNEHWQQNFDCEIWKMVSYCESFSIHTDNSCDVNSLSLTFLVQASKADISASSPRAARSTFNTRFDWKVKTPHRGSNCRRRSIGSILRDRWHGDDLSLIRDPESVKAGLP